MEELVLRINPVLAKRYMQAANFYIETNRYLETLKLFEEVVGKYEKKNNAKNSEVTWIYAKFRKPNGLLKTINRFHCFFPTFTKRIAFIARAQFLLGIYVFAVKDEHGKLIITDYKRL